MDPASPIQYTAIGDSLSVGTGSFLAPGFEKPYAQLTEQTLQVPVKVNIFAKNGATSQEILQNMRTGPVKESLYHSSIITITAGGNDLIHAARQYKKKRNPSVFQEALQDFSANLSTMIGEIYAFKATTRSPFIIRLVGLYNPFPKVAGSDHYIRSFNSCLHRFAGGNMAVADIQYLFQQYGKKVLSLDGLHPNGKGYQLIAYSLYQLGYRPLI